MDFTPAEEINYLDFRFKKMVNEKAPILSILVQLFQSMQLYQLTLPSFQDFTI